MALKTIHVLQHVEVEGPGYIIEWAKNNSVQINYTRLFNGDALPNNTSFDLLLIMGGPMGVNDSKDYPWILQERKFINKCINANKAILGICLGAQFLAKAMGGKVYKNLQPEIGWFPITRCENLPAALHNLFPNNATVFHWHGDTFDIPVGALPLYSSKATPNQGFIYADKVIALQFHLEATKDAVVAMTTEFEDELTKADYVQDAKEILARENLISENNVIMSKILNYLLH